MDKYIPIVVTFDHDLQSWKGECVNAEGRPIG